jgi:hypothetical protein
MQIGWAVAVPGVVWRKVDGYVLGAAEHQIDEGERIAGVPDDVDGVGERVAPARPWWPARPGTCPRSWMAPRRASWFP